MVSAGAQVTMRMWGSCRSSNRMSARRHAGYTLLEMVAVIALIALATALVAPPGMRMVRTWQDASEVSDVIEQIERLPGAVRASGNTLILTGEVLNASLELPDGWALILDTPLTVQANGACSNAKARLQTVHQEIELQILAPFCRVQRVVP